MVVYRVIALDAQVARAPEATNGLQQNTDAMREAVNAHVGIRTGLYFRNRAERL